MATKEDERTNPGTPNALATLNEVHAGVAELLRRFDALESDRRAELRDIHRRLDALEAQAAE